LVCDILYEDSEIKKLGIFPKLYLNILENIRIKKGFVGIGFKDPVILSNFFLLSIAIF